MKTTIVTPEEARAIAREAYLYGFPLVETYKTLYKQAIDQASPDYKAPLNQLGHFRTVATPDDRFVVTPNSDTPYSVAWLDQRAEPMVITMPKIESNRYYSVQLIDLYTHNAGYLGTRSFGNEGGDFLIAGPGWRGEKPQGIRAVISCETQIMYALFRTQLLNSDDLKNVHQIQDAYRVRPLSTYLGNSAPNVAPAVDWPPLADGMSESVQVFGYLNFLLQFCPTHPSEKELMERFAKLGIGAGKPFHDRELAPEMNKAIEAGIAVVWQEDFAAFMKQVNAGEVTSGGIFGTREFIKNNYLYRFAGAKLGLYGNSREEAFYPPFFVDAQGDKLDGAKHAYVLRFEKGQLPPAGAFWSFTMYDGKTQYLVANPLNRYLLNSTMLDSFQYGADGSLTLYVQKDSPEGGKESNWLPAPDGPFYCMMRIYIPQPAVFNGQWKLPPLQRMAEVQASAVASGGQELPTTGGVETRIGQLRFEGGYPANETIDILYEEMDFQRAVQAYLWAIPLVSFAQWQQEHEKVFGAKDGDVVYYVSYRDKLGLLTSNATTPYILGFLNLSHTGPLVIDYPAGPTAGGILDFWQRPVTDMGLTGPDKGAGGKYLVLGPGQSVDAPDGYIVVRSSMNNIFHAFRVLATDQGEAKKLRESYQAYPYSKRDNPSSTRMVSPDGKQWAGRHPRGLNYWRLVAKMLNAEPVHERDRMLVAMLKPLGIEKGKPFQPDARQKKILAEATIVGEAMAKSLSFAKRQKEAIMYPGRQWKNLVLLEADQETENYTALDERTAWFYEAVTLSAGMTTKTPGKGQVYLGVRKDSNGKWLQGGNNYTLRIPPNPPVEQFWAMTLYDTETRCFIENEHEIAGLDSRMDLAKNNDGSVDLYFGPEPPKGHEKNWIPTVSGRGWFAYLRLYAPTEPYFDRSWQLPDIEEDAR